MVNQQKHFLPERGHIDIGRDGEIHKNEGG